MVSEVVITLPEYRQFFQYAADEAAGRLNLIHHASWNDLAQNIAAARIAEESGANLVLLSYPPNFYPESLKDIHDYTRAFCAATNLAVMLFPVPLWGFGRLHPADLPVSLIREMLDDCPNIVAIKAEGGYPTIMHYVECWRHFGKEVLISCPIETDLIPLAQLIPMQFSGTSNTEYYGGAIPKMFDLIQRGEVDKATELYWGIHPARKANSAVAGASAGGFLVNRMQWKFQAWLQGYSGGPLRSPTLRIHDAHMNQLRQGLVASGQSPTKEPNKDFFVGRFPT